LKSAELLASLAPTSGHMVHMPGHIFYRVGNYAEAEHWFAASTEADERYMREQKVDVDNDWNHIHNLMYGIANLMEQGKTGAGERTERSCGGRTRQVVGLALYLVGARPDGTLKQSAAGGAAAGRLGCRADHDRPGKDGGRKTANLRSLAGELNDYAKGMQALERDDVVAALVASDRMDAALWRMQQRAADEKAAKERTRRRTTSRKPTRKMNRRRWR